MASNFVNLIVAFFFIVVASSSVAQGIVLDGPLLNIAEIQAVGILTCIIPGSNTPGNPITNATVAINCDGGSFTLGTTDVTGTITAVLRTIDGVVFDSSTCNATITLGNLLSCTAYPPTYTVPVILTFTNIIDSLIGTVALFVASFGIPVLV